MQYLWQGACWMPTLNNDTGSRFQLWVFMFRWDELQARACPQSDILVLGVGTQFRKRTYKFHYKQKRLCIRIRKVIREHKSEM